MYNGTTIAAEPTPSPTTNLPTANWGTEYAAVWSTVPTTKTTHAAQMGIFRPKRSAVSPAPTYIVSAWNQGVQCHHLDLPLQ